MIFLVNSQVISSMRHIDSVRRERLSSEQIHALSGGEKDFAVSLVTLLYEGLLFLYQLTGGRDDGAHPQCLNCNMFCISMRATFSLSCSLNSYPLWLCH